MNSNQIDSNIIIVRVPTFGVILGETGDTWREIQTRLESFPPGPLILLKFNWRLGLDATTEEVAKMIFAKFTGKPTIKIINLSDSKGGDPSESIENNSPKIISGSQDFNQTSETTLHNLFEDYPTLCSTSSQGKNQSYSAFFCSIKNADKIDKNVSNKCTLIINFHGPKSARPHHSSDHLEDEIILRGFDFPSLKSPRIGFSDRALMCIIKPAFLGQSIIDDIVFAMRGLL